MLPLPTFSSRQADHDIAKIAAARYFHGSVWMPSNAAAVTAAPLSQTTGGHQPVPRWLCGRHPRRHGAYPP